MRSLTTATVIAASLAAVVAAHAEEKTPPQPSAATGKSAVKTEAAPTLEGVNESLAALAAKAEAARANPREDHRDAVSTLNLIPTIRQHLAVRRSTMAWSASDTTAAQMETPAFRSAWSKIAADLLNLTRAKNVASIDRIQAAVASLPKDLAEADADLEKVVALQKRFHALEKEFDVDGWVQELGREKDLLQSRVREFASSLDGFVDLLACRASGDHDRALMLGTTALNLQQRAGRAPLTGAIKKQVDELVAEREKSARRLLAEAHAKVTKADGPEAVKLIAEELQRSADQLSKGSAGDPGGLGALHAEEAQRVRHWATVLDLEAQRRNRSAQAILREEMGRAGLRGQHGVPRTSSVVVTDDMLRQKMVAVTRAIADRGDEVVDPAIKELVDTIPSAKTLDDLRLLARRIAATLEGLSQPPVDDAAVVEDLKRLEAQIKTLLEMDAAVRDREWGLFWQVSRNGSPRHPNAYAFSSHRWSAAISQQRMKLIRRALTENDETRDLGGMDENVPVDRCLLGLADAAIAADDYRKAAVALRLYATVAYGDSNHTNGPTLDQEMNSIALYAQAVNFEAAGDYAQAANRYRQVLQFTGQRVPIAKATKRLADILAKKPELAQPAEKPPAAPPGKQPPSQG